MGILDWFRRKPAAPTAGSATDTEEKSPRITAGDVFTPTSSAKRGFVPRGDTQEDVETALGTRGTQLVVYGESGAGKSSLIDHTLDKLKRKRVTTHCTSMSTYEQILSSVFEELKIYAVSEKGAENHADVEVHGTVGNDLTPAKLESGFTVGGTTNTLSTPYVAPQITAQNAERVLAERETTWVIEDLHKVNDEVKAQVADILKVFVNRANTNTGVVVLGVSETAAAIVQAPADVKNRVARIAVKPLTPDELGAIIDTGSVVMNVDMSAVRSEIIKLSSGVASVTHALALRCLRLLGVETPVEGAPTVVSKDTLHQAARGYARSMSGDMQEKFALGIKLKRQRTYDNCAMILKAVASLPESGGTHAEILAKIRETKPSYPPSNLSNFLPQLTEEDRGELLRMTPDGRWRYDEPLQHTFAQILFSIPSAGDDVFADALSEQIPESQRQEALEAANVTE